LRYYNVLIAILAVVSIVMVILDYSSLISLTASPYWMIDDSILAIFTIDYVVRLIRAPQKWKFFTHNIFDLLAIIPFSAIFSFFRFARAFRIVRLSRAFRLTRLAGVLSILQRRAKKFLHKGGLIYYLWLSLVLIILSAAIYSLTEHATFANSIWWAIVTATTVGYGDISPHTLLGRVVAVMLMFNGIGVIGMLTSSITTYLSDDDGDDTSSQIDDLVKLKGLLDSGGITHGEYEQLKEKIIKEAPSRLL
jgi:voltage-gated potassium channel